MQIMTAGAVVVREAIKLIGIAQLEMTIWFLS
jgi:hypothetical protein